MEPETNDRPLILVCNDDGIDAPGIRQLAASMAPLGEIWVVAPAHEQSAVGHAITVRDPVRLEHRALRLEGDVEVEGYAVVGTPADCVKLAIHHLLPRKPDLVVSGINRGPNTAVNVIYSGTVSAATEASLLGVDAIAFSLCKWGEADYGAAGAVAQKIARNVLKDGLPPGILLNVNVPYLAVDEMQGIKITRQAKSRWEESFEERQDPLDQPYFWLTGTFVNLDEDEGTDLEAIENGFVSVTPLGHDLTAHQHLDMLAERSWEDEQRVRDEA